MTPSAVRIALVYPELLGTYGDGGNALVCRERLLRRTIPAEVVMVPAGEPIPSGCDVYLLGGGEDDPQTLAAAGLRGPALSTAVEGGAVLLAVCAGFQIIGESFPGQGGADHPGVGLVDIRTRAGSPRAVGDLAVRPAPALGLPLLFGYENHGGRTEIGGHRPLGEVARGTGNGSAKGTGTSTRKVDGLVAELGKGLVVGTYLHGPALAQNPDLADFLLARVTGPLPPLDLPDTAALRTARARQLGL
ncbi:MAG: type 1 glutamine amidotransferase [Mycobacteriales bacterium]